MDRFTPLHRDLLKGLGSLAMFTVFAEGAGASMASAQPEEKPGMLNGRDFGAKGDGKSDDTAAFRQKRQPSTAGGG